MGDFVYNSYEETIMAYKNIQNLIPESNNVEEWRNFYENVRNGQFGLRPGTFENSPAGAQSKGDIEAVMRTVLSLDPNEMVDAGGNPAKMQGAILQRNLAYTLQTMNGAFIQSSMTPRQLVTSNDAPDLEEQIRMSINGGYDPEAFPGAKEEGAVSSFDPLRPEPGNWDKYATMAASFLLAATVPAIAGGSGQGARGDNNPDLDKIMSTDINGQGYTIADFAQHMNQVLGTPSDTTTVFLQPFQMYDSKAGFDHGTGIDDLMGVLLKYQSDSTFNIGEINPFWQTLSFTDEGDSVKVDVVGDWSHRFDSFRVTDSTDVASVKSYLENYKSSLDLEMMKVVQRSDEELGRMFMKYDAGDNFFVGDDGFNLKAQTADNGGPAFLWWAGYKVGQKYGKLPKEGYTWEGLSNDERSWLTQYVTQRLIPANQHLKDKNQDVLVDHYMQHEAAANKVIKEYTENYGFSLPNGKTDIANLTEQERRQALETFTDYWVMPGDEITVIPLQGLTTEIDLEALVNNIGTALTSMGKDLTDYTDQKVQEAKDYTDQVADSLGQKIGANSRDIKDLSKSVTEMSNMFWSNISWWPTVKVWGGAGFHSVDSEGTGYHETSEPQTALGGFKFQIGKGKPQMAGERQPGISYSDVAIGPVIRAEFGAQRYSHVIAAPTIDENTGEEVGNVISNGDFLRSPSFGTEYHIGLTFDKALLDDLEGVLTGSAFWGNDVFHEKYAGMNLGRQIEKDGLNLAAGLNYGFGKTPKRNNIGVSANYSSWNDVNTDVVEDKEGEPRHNSMSDRSVALSGSKSLGDATAKMGISYGSQFSDQLNSHGLLNVEMGYIKGALSLGFGDQNLTNSENITGIGDYHSLGANGGYVSYKLADGKKGDKDAEGVELRLGVFTDLGGLLGNNFNLVGEFSLDELSTHYGLDKDQFQDKKLSNQTFKLGFQYHIR